MPQLQQRGSSALCGWSTGKVVGPASRSEHRLPLRQAPTKCLGQALDAWDLPSAFLGKRSWCSRCGSQSPKRPPTILAVWYLYLCIVPSPTESQLICVTKWIQRRWWWWILRLHHKRHWHFCFALLCCSLWKEPWGYMNSPMKRLTWRGTEAANQQPASTCQAWELEVDRAAPVPANILTTLQNLWPTETVRNNKWILLLALTHKVWK